MLFRSKLLFLPLSIIVDTATAGEEGGGITAASSFCCAESDILRRSSFSSRGEIKDKSIKTNGLLSMLVGCSGTTLDRNFDCLLAGCCCIVQRQRKIARL